MKSRCGYSVLLLTLVSISASSGLEWKVAVVDGGGAVINAGTSVAIASGDYPHMSYLSYFSPDDSVGLFYVYWDGDQWHKQNIFQLWIYFETQTSLSLDKEDNPHIAHGWHGGTGALMMYSFWDGADWQHMHIPYLGEAVHNDITVDDFGCSHIAHIWISDVPCPISPIYSAFGCPQKCGSDVDTVDYMWWGNGHVSLALSSTSSPCLCYNLNNRTDPGLKYAFCVENYIGEKWNIEKVDTVPEAPHTSGTAISLNLDVSDHPHVSYYDDLHHDLKWARKIGGNWEIGAVDSFADVGSCNSLVLDDYGFEHISYYDATHKDLKCAHWNGRSWEIERVDTLGQVGDVNSIAIDDDGCLHISYYDAMNKFLKYAKSTSTHICSGVKGDVDGNSTIDVIDVVQTVRHILGIEILEFCSRVRADCNADGQIDITDVLGIVNVILNVSTCQPTKGN
ncbi:MAG: hypothetical protein JSV84_02830 [Gemmatimonadota bacterium]|nr:MAG: hypothetical protein JSV84_02830 [Gemmatimonadota bacterium]